MRECRRASLSSGRTPTACQGGPGMIRRLCGSGSWLSAFKGAAVYAVFGVLWIYFSDTILASFIRDPGLLTFFRSCMGWLFVVFTALFVFCLLRRHGLEVERSHEDLEKSEASLDILFRVLPIGVGTAKGRFLVMVNDSLCEMTGYSRDEIVGHETRRLYVDDAEFERVGKVLYRDTARKGRCLLEARWRHKDGHEMDVLFGAAVAHEGAAATDIVFSVMDITEQREREALYGLLFEGAHDALMLMDRRVFLDCNPRALEMFGVDRLQLLKASPLDFSPRLQPDGRKSSLAATERIAAALAGEPQVFEWRHLRGDGTPFDTEISLNHIAMRGGGYLLSIARDITERKQTLEALKKSEDYLASIFRAAPIGIAVVDNRVLVDVNDRFCDIFGYDRRELLGRDSRMLYVSEEEYLRCGREYYRCLDTDGHCSVSAHGVRKDGRDIHMLANASMLSSDSGGTAVTFCVLDITDRKLAEERLQQSEERYRELFQSSHLGIFLADDEPRIFDANPRATWITGFSRDELCAFHATDIVHPDSLREASLEEVTDRAADGPIVYERLYRSKGGGAVPVEVNLIVSPVNGYHTVMFQDITARKQAEAKLNESREHLARIIEHSPVGISLMSHGLPLPAGQSRLLSLRGLRRGGVAASLSVRPDPPRRYRGQPASSAGPGLRRGPFHPVREAFRTQGRRHQARPAHGDRHQRRGRGAALPGPGHGHHGPQAGRGGAQAIPGRTGAYGSRTHRGALRDRGGAQAAQSRVRDHVTPGRSAPGLRDGRGELRNRDRPVRPGFPQLFRLSGRV